MGNTPPPGFSPRRRGGEDDDKEGDGTGTGTGTDTKSVGISFVLD